MKRNMRFLALIPLLILQIPLIGQIAVDGELTRHKETNPGDVYEGIISIHNKGDKEEQAKVYLRDFSFSADGQMTYGEPDDNERTNANWITFSPSNILLPPGGREDIKYTVRVPDYEELTGTYWSMLFIEDVPKAQSIEPDPDQTISIMQVVRFGIQIITDMEGEALAQLKFMNTKFTNEESGKFLNIQIENTGNKWLTPELYAELYNELGEFVGRFEGEKARLYPSTSVSRTFDLSSVTEGTYRVLVIADCGEDLLFGGKYTLVIGN